MTMPADVKTLGVRIPLFVLASVETLVTLLIFARLVAIPSPTLSPGIWVFFASYSLPISLAGWALFGLTFLRRQSSSRVFASRGFDRKVYALMVEMRGASSRLMLLRSLETPKHRNELADTTGIDWKEVDRQMSLFEKYGLTKVYASSGAIKMYQLTEQGKVLLQLIDELRPN
jgi:hypothetical protein